jgi:hypothetical protein
MMKKILLNYSIQFIGSKFSTGMVAKKMGGKKGLALNDEELKIWQDICIDLQKEICRYKYVDIKSKNKILVHSALRCSTEKIKYGKEEPQLLMAKLIL